MITGNSAAGVAAVEAKRSRVALSCRHCQEAWCIDACISGAMHRTADGVVTNTGTDQGCVGC